MKKKKKNQNVQNATTGGIQNTMLIDPWYTVVYIIGFLTGSGIKYETMVNRGFPGKSQSEATKDQLFFSSIRDCVILYTSDQMHIAPRLHILIQ